MTRVPLAALSLVLTLLLASCDPGQPPDWTDVVPTEGQAQPVPARWTVGEEALIAHSLKLPDSVPKPVPFDFTTAWWKSQLPKAPSVALQYFDHLCATEAGEWIFKKVENVEGFYFARPQSPPTDDFLLDRYGPENPWIQRVFQLQGENPRDHGGWFIQPPLYNYSYVEQPRRAVKWQEGFQEPYVRLYGYTTKYALEPDGRRSKHFNPATPMESKEIPQLVSKQGYTWRGIKRQRDREHGIAGGDLLIYDLASKEVLAVRRQFLLTTSNTRGAGDAMWFNAPSCTKYPSNGLGGEFNQFAFDVLQTSMPSVAVRR